MRNRGIQILILCVLAVFCVRCDTEDMFPLEGNQTVFIADYTFSPREVTASPGQDVIFFNMDNEPHRILSQSAEDAFDNTGAFDSLPIPSGEVSSITIPDTAVVGDQFFFYDDYLQDAMATPSGVITIE